LKQLAAVLPLLAIAGVARAGDPAATPYSFLHDLVRDVRARIAAAIAARPPVLVPPTPVAVRYKLVRIGSFDLGAPLVALAGADLDGDGTGELYAVTSREVVAIAVRGRKLVELGRVAFAGEAAVPMPRDVVGTATVEGRELVASVSSWAKGMRVTWQGKALTATAGDAGFVLCPGERALLAPGRNYFGTEAAGYYVARCSSGMVAADGTPIRTRSQLSLAGDLAIELERCTAHGVGCRPATRYAYGGIGFAFDIADVDRDGTPEVIYSGAGAPGDPDVIKVVTLGDDDKKQAKLKKAFTAGGVAGIAVADLDGNRVQDVVAAVRLVGATRVDLWRLE
jgi:hypothetical protein